MKLFIDTNIFIEYFECRLQFESVRKIFNALEDKRHVGFIYLSVLFKLLHIL